MRAPRRKPAQTTGAGTAQEQKRTAKLGETLPRGIRIGVRDDGRPKPWFVRWGPKRLLESFADEQARNDRAAQLAEERDKEGVAALDYDPVKYKAWLALEKRTGATVEQLEEAWNHRPKKALSMKLTITDAKERFLALRLTEDLVEGSDQYSHLKLHLRRLAEEFGPKMVGEPTPDELRALMHGLKDPETGKPMSKVTKRQHRKSWFTFFKRAVIEGWRTENPCLHVIPPKADPNDKVPLKAREIFDLLKANRERGVALGLAFELFGFLRCSGVERLQPDHIKRSIKGIRLPGVVKDEETGEQKRNTKSGVTKFLQGHPDVLWAWYDFAQARFWADITEKNYDEQKAAAFVRADVANPGNVLRDSAASYLMAFSNNPPLVCRLMQHTDLRTTEIYVGVAEEADAKLVMAMTPDAVALTWEQFLKTNKAAA